MTVPSAARALQGRTLTRDAAAFTRRAAAGPAEHAPAGRTGRRRSSGWRTQVARRPRVVGLPSRPARGRRAAVHDAASCCDSSRTLLDDAARRRDDAGCGLAGRGRSRRAATSRPTLSAEQRPLVVRALPTRRRRPGRPRAGRHRQDVRARRRARGLGARAASPVIGCALSARAALELRDQAAHRRHDASRGCEPPRRRRRDLARGSRARRRRGRDGRHPRPRRARRGRRARSSAKLVLVGDDRQLPEIQAGGAFRALAERLGASRAARGPTPGTSAGIARRSTRCAAARSSGWARAYRDHGPPRRPADRRRTARRARQRLVGARRTGRPR